MMKDAPPRDSPHSNLNSEPLSLTVTVSIQATKECVQNSVQQQNFVIRGFIPCRNKSEAC